MESFKRRKVVAIVAMVLFITLLCLVGIFFGPKMVELVKEPEAFSQWVGTTGVRGKLAFIAMVVAQVIVAVIPGEPFEIAAGFAFGIVEGTVLCLVGTFIGGLLVFYLTRKLGMKFVELFFDPEKIAKLSWLKDEKKMSIIVFWLFFIPGTPKDVLTYFVGLTPIKIRQWLLISLTARLPSIITSTIAGHFLDQNKWEYSLITFGVTGLIALLGMIFYNRISKNKAKTRS